jgi:hypothetical protein
MIIYKYLNKQKPQLLTKLNNINTNNKNEIVKTWISGQKSVTLILERKLAEEYDLIDPQHVIVERKANGILIRKLEEV